MRKPVFRAPPPKCGLRFWTTLNSSAQNETHDKLTTTVLRCWGSAKSLSDQLTSYILGGLS